jgi:plastocyanin
MRGLALIAFIALAAGCGSSYDSSGGMAAACTPATATATNSVTISGMAFSPSCVKVAAGATVTFTNADAIAHTVTGDGGGFDSGAFTTAPYAHAFAAAGTFPYHCQIHPTMRGTVIAQ